MANNRIRFGRAPVEQVEPKAGQVTIQWKCAEKHENCEARHWKFYTFAGDCEAKALVERYNKQTTLLKYRVKP
jgi:hypothetical protein